LACFIGSKNGVAKKKKKVTKKKIETRRLTKPHGIEKLAREKDDGESGKVFHATFNSWESFHRWRKSFAKKSTEKKTPMSDRLGRSTDGPGRSNRATRLEKDAAQ